MPHLSRLLAAICAITVILVSLPSDAGIGDKDLPLLNGQKTKLLYTVVGVTNFDNELATAFHCTSTEPSGGSDIHVGIQVFYEGGNLVNDVAADEGSFTLGPGRTRTTSTQNTTFNEVNNIDVDQIDQGSARIVATSKKVLCTAMLLESENSPPTSMVMLPVFRMTKQGGM